MRNEELILDLVNEYFNIDTLVKVKKERMDFIKMALIARLQERELNRSGVDDEDGRD